MESLPENGYIRLSKLIKCIPVSKTTIWRLSRENKFPKPVRLTEKTTAWKCEEIHAWLASREAA